MKWKNGGARASNMTPRWRTWLARFGTVSDGTARFELVAKNSTRAVPSLPYQGSMLSGSDVTLQALGGKLKRCRDAENVDDSATFELLPCETKRPQAS